MNAYIDASVVIRLLFDESNPIRHWGAWRRAVSNELAKIEVWRAIHRLRLEKHLTDEEFANLSDATAWLLAQIDFIRLDPRVLRRSAGHFRTIIKTLDAIHLTSALLWREENREPLKFLTHDQQLRRAARAYGFEVQPISKS